MNEERVWRPHKRQEEFIAVPDSVFEALYGGAAGGGKSEILLMLPLVRKWTENPRFKALLLRRTYPELEREIILRSQDPFHAAGAHYNDEKKRWVFPSGAIYQFGHCEFENDVRKYDTSEYNYLAFDELTSFTEWQYIYLTSRCRSSTENLPAVVRTGATPDNIGVGWVRARFVEPAPYNTIIRHNGLKRIFVQALPTDNPYLLKNDPGYTDRLQILPEAERRAKLGDWFIFSGQVFDDWRENPLPDEPDNARHVIPEFSIPEFWPKFLAVDWGFSAMTCALWGTISSKRQVIIYREYTALREKISTWASDIARLSQHEDLRVVVLDPSAWANRGDEKTIAEQFEFHSGLRPTRADNDRVGGKVLLQEYLRWRPRPARKIPEEGFDEELAQSILRQQGLDAYKGYCDSFRVESEREVLPRLQVFKSCEKLRKTIPLCVYDQVRKEDVASFNGDDPYDTIRYLIKVIDSYIVTSHKDLDHLEQVAKACFDFEARKDQTRFYRRMEFLERAKRYSPAKAVRRFHSA